MPLNEEDAQTSSQPVLTTVVKPVVYNEQSCQTIFTFPINSLKATNVSSEDKAPPVTTDSNVNHIATHFKSSDSATTEYVRLNKVGEGSKNQSPALTVQTGEATDGSGDDQVNVIGIRLGISLSEAFFNDNDIAVPLVKSEATEQLSCCSVSTLSGSTQRIELKIQEAYKETGEIIPIKSRILDMKKLVSLAPISESVPIMSEHKHSIKQTMNHEDISKFTKLHSSDSTLQGESLEHTSNYPSKVANQELKLVPDKEQTSSNISLTENNEKKNPVLDRRMQNYLNTSTCEEGRIQSTESNDFHTQEPTQAGPNIETILKTKYMHCPQNLLKEHLLNSFNFRSGPQRVESVVKELCQTILTSAPGIAEPRDVVQYLEHVAETVFCYKQIVDKQNTQGNEASEESNICKNTNDELPSRKLHKQSSQEQFFDCLVSNLECVKESHNSNANEIFEKFKMQLEVLQEKIQTKNPEDTTVNKNEQITAYSDLTTNR